MIKIKEFDCYQSNDNCCYEVQKRFKNMRKEAFQWIEDNSIDVINIQEEEDYGGHWMEEERGGTIKIFYKELDK